MEISIDLLKSMALEVYNKVKPQLGSEKAAEKLKKGAGGDISMRIDLTAEKVIIDLLERQSVDLLLISEELGEKFIGNKQKAIKSQLKLIVDPIDGSNNAVRGIPFCSVSIAYAIGNTLNDILKAVIIDLTTKDLYWAEKNNGAFLNDKRISVSSNKISRKCIFEINVSKKNLVKDLIKYKSIIDKIFKVRVMGSTALTLCQLAKGSIDAFLNLRESNRLVDVAAGILILKEAGGKFFSKEGLPLDIKLSIKTKFPFIASNSILEPFLREKLIKINSIK
ncbi:MAG: inositol monophosphatase family protein [Promethearchaeota archaeon]